MCEQPEPISDKDKDTVFAEPLQLVIERLAERVAVLEEKFDFVHRGEDVEVMKARILHLERRAGM